MLGLRVAGREVAVGKLDPYCVGDDGIVKGRVNDANNVIGFGMGIRRMVVEVDAQAVFIVFQLFFNGYVAIYEFIAGTCEAGVVQDGERWNIGDGAWTEE